MSILLYRYEQLIGCIFTVPGMVIKVKGLEEEEKRHGNCAF
jgi:hypothetical protein